MCLQYLKMKKNSFKKYLQRFCLDSSITGLKYLYLYPDYISRCFWSVSLLLVTMSSFFLAFLLYTRFMGMPTRITIENQFEPIAELPYPSITLCSPNQITISSAIHLNKTLVDGNHSVPLNLLLPQLIGFYDVLHIDDRYLEQLDELIDLNRYFIPEVMALLPQSCERFFKRCFFRRQLYDCNTLFKPILTQHGYCCVFNNVYKFKNNRKNEPDYDYDIRKVGKTGLPEGLTVVVDYEPDTALDNTLLCAGSTRVLINDVYEFPADDELSLIEAGTESYHLLSATYTYCSSDVKDLPINSRRCNFAHENFLRHFKWYHNSDCDLMCLVSSVEKICHCQVHFIPNLRLSQACNVTNIRCIQDVKLNDNQWGQAEQCDCPRDCDSRHYTSDTMTGNLDGFDSMTVNFFTGIKFNSSTSVLHFFFPTPVYKKMKQETVMSLTTFCSNLGGAFGLCLGLSTISVLEILFYIYTFIKNKIREHITKAWYRRKRGTNLYTYYN